MFKMVIEHLGKGLGTQSLLLCEESKQHYVVSSVNGAWADETYIFKSDDKGEITDWMEVYGIRPNQHEQVIGELLNGSLTLENPQNEES